MDSGQTANADRLDEFVRLLAEHDRGILLFILSLVPNWADAEEIRQETSVKLWREFGKFELESDFGKWARTIARYEVLTFRTRRQRDLARMSEGSIDLVATEVEAVFEKAKARQAAMAECVEELSAFRRELVRLHYTLGRTVRDIAAELRCMPDALYKTLQRTRVELRRCVDRKVGEGEEA
jgi:RNA polymerase sigma-70 factor (ECF subfamily)